MVVFNELRITDDGEYLFVDCAVENLDIYEGVYIESIYIDSYKNATGTVGDTTKYTLYENTTPDTTVTAKRCTFTKAQLADSNIGESSFRNGIFYVKVTCHMPSATAAAIAAAGYPCGVDTVVDLGVVLDWYNVYSIGMSYIAKMADGCSGLCADNTEFKQFVMLWHALNAAIASEDYILLEKLWTKYQRAMMPSNATYQVSGCGCS